MLIVRQLLAAFILLAGLSAVPAHAETFHTCGTIINTIPTVISSQGVYCLSHDVSTAITSGKAIEIKTNNVTIDCNGYKIGGLAAGSTSLTAGVYADSTRQNITVRNCGIRGFYKGIDLEGGAGHLVEDNRLDNNLSVGIYVAGDNNRVRRNAVYDTGGNATDTSFGIFASAELVDNTVAGVFPVATNTNALGISMGGANQARGNVISGISPTGTGLAYGISAGYGTVLRDNTIVADSTTNGNGISGTGVTSETICSGNVIHKFSTPMFSCADAGGNFSN
jgi:parallel beta-helix repeat protein